MTRIIQKLTLDVTCLATYKTVMAKQGDGSTRVLHLTLTHDGVVLHPNLETMEAAFRCIKPDGKSCLLPVTLLTSGEVEVELTPQVLAVHGRVAADVALLKKGSSETLSTASFFIDVEKIPMSADVAASSNDFLLLVEATRKAEKATADAYAAIEAMPKDILRHSKMDLTPEQKEQALQNLDAVGRKTADGGEVFNKGSQARTCAHAEGDLTSATGYASHAEGSAISEDLVGDDAIETHTFKFTSPIAGVGAVERIVRGSTAEGHSSHAEGSNTLAYGHSSHAEGNNTLAAGGRSHAEGTRTQAIGHRSHAEGADTIANSTNAHAEGNYTQALATNSHAEGFETTVAKEASNAHAEGHGSTASGYAAHAEGRLSIASGYAAHAEGTYYTKTVDGEKISTGSEASGEAAHAEGRATSAQGKYSHAEGDRTISSGQGSHAEGTTTTASGTSAHAEGQNTTASGPYSHTEGHSAKAEGECSHAEGYNNVAKGNYSHAEGYGTEASGSRAHSEGHLTKATGNYSHTEGRGTIATGISQHVQGEYNLEDADGKYLHIVGNGSSDSARSNAHALDKQGNAWFAGDVTGTTPEGDEVSLRGLSSELQALQETEESFQQLCQDNFEALDAAILNEANGNDLAHREMQATLKQVQDTLPQKLDSNRAVGRIWRDGDIRGEVFNVYNGRNAATMEASHAEGYENSAVAQCSHVEGHGNVAAGYASHAEGRVTQANGHSSHAEGQGTIAKGHAQHAEGMYNEVDPSTAIYDTQPVWSSNMRGKYIHIAGNGTKDVRSNAHTLDWEGNAVFAGTVSGNGADYAELFEWTDGNPNAEDRVGYLVALEADKIRLAEPGDDILGVVSGTVGVLGDNAAWSWKSKYLRDDFGRILYDSVEVFEDVPDITTGEVTKKSLGFYQQPRINPEYDPTQVYQPRTERPEWSSVGLLGKLHLRDDGTAQVNGYVCVGASGVATASTEKTNLRVLSRVSDTVIRVLLK